MPTGSRSRYPHLFSPGRAGPGFVGEGSRDPRWSGVIYDAVAYFSRPVGGLRRFSTHDQRQGGVAAETPEAAARKWLWRLDPDQRAATERVILWGGSDAPAAGRHYVGPALVYAPRGGRLVLVERRGG